MKIKSIIIALALATVASGMAYAAVPRQNDKGKWGYVDDSGAKIVDYKYDEAGYFTDGLALVKKGDNLGMINESGKEIIPVKYNIIEPHNAQIFRVAANGKMKDGVLMDEKYGFVNREGVEVLKPEYDEVGGFVNGMAYIKKGATYGYINEDIKVVIPCKYAAVGKFNDKGLTWVNEGAKYDKNSTSSFTGGKYGVIDRTGKVIVPVKYKSAGVFKKYSYTPSDEELKKMTLNEKTITLECPSHYLLRKIKFDKVNLAKLSDEIYGLYGSPRDDGYNNAVFTLDGEVLIKEGKFYSALYPTEGLAVVTNKADQYNYLNMATGELLFKKYIYDGWAFEDGVAVIERTEGGGNELIDMSGNPISSTYDKIYPRKDGLYIVRSSTSNDKYYRYGAIDAKGNEVVPANHTYLYPPSHGYMACKDDNKAGFRDLQGNWAHEGFKSSFSFVDGYASVKTDNGWGLIDTEGKQVVKCRWKDTISKNVGKTGLMFVSDEEGDNNGYMLLDIKTDKVLSTAKYKWIRTFLSDYEDVAIVGDDNQHVGILNKEGKLIIPAIFTVSQARVAYQKYLTRSNPVWTEFDTYCTKLLSNPNRNKGKLSSKLESTLWDY